MSRLFGKRKKKQQEDFEIWEDVWVPTLCHRCMCDCALRVHRINGVAVEIEGNPDTEVGSYGGLCPKSASGLQLLYDPNRINYPMRRTNPKKGLGEDPKWERISWDEALDEIAQKTKAAWEKSPDRVILQHGILNGTHMAPLIIVPMLGTLNDERGSIFHFNAGGGQCGSALHFMTALNYGCFIIHEDWERCNYALIWGTNIGAGGMQQFRNRMCAEARARGAKIVVFDPMCNGNASKAGEWIPLKPGTDTAVALGLLNVICNELHMIDAERLKRKTDAPYLIVEDGHFLRDNEKGDPMIWDPSDGCAKIFDDPNIRDYALDGEYEVNGKKVRPCFAAMCERFAEYPPEKVEEISRVPAATIRRIAKEFATAASIGATCEIDGQTLPLRPVLSIPNRAPGAHKNGFHATWACDALNHVVGAGNVPGSIICMANECHGFPETGQPKYEFSKGKDGFGEITGKWQFPGGFWPPRKPAWPAVDLESVFPHSLEMPTPSLEDFFEVQEAFGLRTHWDVMINYAANGALDGANPLARDRFYKAVDYIVDIDIFSTEFNEAYADILLPDKCYLERTDFQGLQHSYHNQPGIPGLDWCFHITQPVIEQQYERRDGAVIIEDILKRMGLGDRLKAVTNDYFFLKGTKYEFTPDEELTFEEICDRATRRIAGDAYGFDWFRENGYIRKEKTVDECFWSCFKDIRMHLYHEYLLDTRAEFEKLIDRAGLKNQVFMDAYDPLLKYFPIGVTEDENCDLFAFSWMDVTQIGTNGQEQPWIDEVSRMNPFTYFINLNPKTAAEKGLKAGDHVEVISSDGLKADGLLALRPGISPDCVAIMGNAGHTAHGLTIAKGKGVSYNRINGVHFRDLDPITGSLEVANKVRIRKADD